MNLKRLYFSLKKKFRDHSGISYGELTSEQRDYILSGIDQEILDNYKIIYSPKRVVFSPSSQGTRIKRSLERKLDDLVPDFSSSRLNVSSMEDYFINFKRDLLRKHKKNMEILRLNHLRKLNELYSRIVYSYNQGMKNLVSIFSYDIPGGGIKLSFEQQIL